MDVNATSVRMNGAREGLSIEEVNSQVIDFKRSSFSNGIVLRVHLSTRFAYSSVQNLTLETVSQKSLP